MGKRDKAERERCETDYDRCVLMMAGTALTLHGLISNNEDEDKKKQVCEAIALPFVVAKGKHCSLYVTRINDQKQVSIQPVKLDATPITGSSTKVDFSSSGNKQRAQVFIALALLLDDVLRIIHSGNYQNYKPNPVVGKALNFSSK